MSFRNRAVLDRKHRPRWEEERRTQQIVVAAFAVTIAVALGIFGATRWGDYYDNHLRPVASVGGAVFDRDALSVRTRIVQVELGLEAQRIQARATDQAVLEQQLSVLQQEVSVAESTAAESLVRGAVQRELAGDLGVAVTDAEVDAEIAARATTPEDVRLSIIAVNAVAPEAPGAPPTDADFEVALDEARAILDALRGGADFAQLAAGGSDDPSAQNGGDIGFFGADDPRYAQLFAVTRSVEVGTTLGPIRTPAGYTIARVTDRRAPILEARYLEAFEDAGVGRADYRTYIADELYDERFRTYFEDEVVTSRQEQRRVAQILIGEQAGGEAAPERRVRHVLIQPIPGAQDQTTATDAQWQAALDQALEVRAQLLEPDADWQAIAAEVSGDPGSGQRGGDLGWAPATGTGFVAEFAEAVSTLPVGQLSQPIRTQFGYHVLEVTDERQSAQAQLDAIVAELEEDPTRFEEIARRSSEDFETAQAGGEIGWIARYELDPLKEEAIWALPAVGDVSPPVVVQGEGTYIFQLLELSAEREVEEGRLEAIRRAGYDRWFSEQRSLLEVWIDPEFQQVPQAPAQGQPF